MLRASKISNNEALPRGRKDRAGNLSAQTQALRVRKPRLPPPRLFALAKRFPFYRKNRAGGFTRAERSASSSVLGSDAFLTGHSSWGLAGPISTRRPVDWIGRRPAVNCPPAGGSASFRKAAQIVACLSGFNKAFLAIPVPSWGICPAEAEALRREKSSGKEALPFAGATNRGASSWKISNNEALPRG